MALKHITDPNAVAQAIAQFDALGREEFLKQYGFGPARRYLVDHAGQLYDSKALLGAAHSFQFPEQGPLRSTDFSGGEMTTVKKLQDLGFKVVPVSADTDASVDPGPPISELLPEVLSLQHSWSQQNTPEMQRRGELIRKLIPRSLQSLMPSEGVLPFAPRIEGSDGVGRKAHVPWIRIYSGTHSPSAMNGWYVVLLFAADGTAAYLSVGSGTSQVIDGVFRLRPAGWLNHRIAWARDVLASSDTDGLAQHIDLADHGTLGAQYERGTIVAYRFAADEVIDDGVFAEVLLRLLHLLGELYTHGEPDDYEELAVQQAVHLLLKWNPVDDLDRIEKHKEVALAHDGRVWWGSFTKDDPPRRISSDRVNKIREQLARGVDTTAYLYRLGPSPAVWTARVEGISNDRAEVDEDRLPTYYGPAQRHTAYVLLREIEPFDVEALLENVVLAKNPIAGSLAPTLKNQTSPVDVVHLADSTMDSTTGKATDGLTKEWLAKQTMWSADAVDELLGIVLGPQPHVILAGPPGTGKTWVARALARYLTQDRHVYWRLVQFHPSYSYESFIEGLRPVVEDGAVSFERVDGELLRLAKAARLNDLPHVLIIDELNRANVPRTLGELMFLLEYRSETIDLQFSQGFALPPNIAFIATMNTADRSIRSIDVALRRRFEIIECLPDPTVLGAFYASDQAINFVPDLVAGFATLNRDLAEQLDKHHTIGQTFFMADQMTIQTLRRVWKRKVYPLIEEYFFDAPDLAQEFKLQRYWPGVDED